MKEKRKKSEGGNMKEKRRKSERLDVNVGMRKNWQSFVDSTEAKSKSHMKSARYWSTAHVTLNLTLIFLGAITTCLALLDKVPSLVVAGVAGATTLVSTVSAFLQPAKLQQLQLEASKVFRCLMMKMVRCETEKEYEDLWREYNKAIMEAPFLPKKYITQVPMDWSLTPELSIVIKDKEDEVNEKMHGNERNSEKDSIHKITHGESYIVDRTSDI